MHEDRGCLANFVPVNHYAVGRQVLEGMDRTAEGKEATSTWHDMIIPPAPERTLNRRDER